MAVYRIAKIITAHKKHNYSKADELCAKIIAIRRPDWHRGVLFRSQRSLYGLGFDFRSGQLRKRNFREQRKPENIYNVTTE